MRRALARSTAAAALASGLAAAMAAAAQGQDVGGGPGSPIATVTPGQSSEQRTQARQPPYVLLRADEVVYDQNAGIVTATGNVEIAHGDEVLRADMVTYDEKRDIVTAAGDVVMLRPSGEVVFADRAEFTSGMKDGVVEGFRMLLSDDSRLAAAGATRTGGIITTLNKAVFSPCDLCPDDPDRPPLWRIRSVRVIHDSERKEIEHKDAFLEFYGVPILYTPYLSHPDPTVKRRTGLLAPHYGADSTFGFVLRTPFFWEIAPNEDVTVTPHFLTEEADVLSANYRRLFTSGQVELDGSITRPDRRDAEGNRVAERDTRGHLFATGRFDHTEIWRTRFQVQHASDDTYLRRYRFPRPSEQTLTTKFTTEGFYGRSYAQVSGYSFQGLRETDDPGESPLVLPYASHSYVSPVGTSGGYVTADSNLLAITRGEGTDSRRLSFNGGWHLPHLAATGEIYRLSATLQTDVYSVNDVVTDVGIRDSGVTGRVFPQVMGEWRYPFARTDELTTQVIEPRAAVVLAPNGGNPDLIPNEDSLAVEFDHTNLFALNRFGGVDRVESGTRFIYGLNWNVYGNRGGLVETFIGQSYRLEEQSEFGPATGLRDQLSDLVGQVRVAPASWLDLLYRFRITPQDFDPQRNELQVSVGPESFKLGVNYLLLDEDGGSGLFEDREELVLSFRARLAELWSAGGHIRQNLAENGTIDESLSLVYSDECFTFRVVGTRTFTTDRDLRPTDSLMLQLVFKHLGDLSFGG